MSHSISILVIFTSGDRLGIYNIKHSLIKVLVLSIPLSHKYTRLDQDNVSIASIMPLSESSASLTHHRAQALDAISSLQRLRGSLYLSSSLFPQLFRVYDATSHRLLERRLPSASHYWRTHHLLHWTQRRRSCRQSV